MEIHFMEYPYLCKLFFEKYLFYLCIKYHIQIRMSFSKTKIFMLGILGFLVAFAITVFVLGKYKFISLYQAQPYKKLMKKIGKQQHVIIEGLPEDGVDVFAAYVLNITLPSQHTVNQRIFSPETVIKDATFPYFSFIKSFVTDSFGGFGGSRVWLIDADEPLKKQHMKAVYELITTKKDDRIVLVTTESGGVKSKIFQKITYPRPSEQSIRELLKKEGLSAFQQTNVLNYYGNNLENLKLALEQNTLLEYQTNYKDIIQVVRTQLKDAKPKVITTFKALCKNGKIENKNRIHELLNLQSIKFINGLYLWRSNNHRLAYQSIVEKNCFLSSRFYEDQQEGNRIKQENKKIASQNQIIKSQNSSQTGSQNKKGKKNKNSKKK